MKKSIKILLVIVLTFLCEAVSGQYQYKKSIDSLTSTSFSTKAEIGIKYNKLFTKIKNDTLKGYLKHQEGKSYLNHGFYHSGINSFSEAVRTREAIFSNPNYDLGNSYYALAYMECQISRFSESNEHLKKAIKIFRATKAKVRIAFCQKLLAENYWKQGKLEEAINYFRLSVNFFKKTKGEVSDEVAYIHNHLGTIYHKLNKSKDALESFNTAIKITNELDKSGKESTIILINKGYFWNDQRKYNLAKKVFKKAINFFEKEPNNNDNMNYLLLAQEGLGLSYKNNRNFDLAIPILISALNLRELLNKGEKSEQLNRSFHNLGDLFLMKKEYQKSLQYFQKAIRQQILDYNNEDIFSNPIFENANFLGSKSSLVQDFSFKADAFHQWYSSSQNQKHLKAAHQSYKKALELTDLMRAEFSAKGSKQFWLKETFPIFEKAIQVTNELYQITKDAKYEEEIFQIMEKNKAILLLEAISESKENLFTNIPDSVLNQQTDLVTQISESEKKLFDIKQTSSSSYSLINMTENQLSQLKIKQYELTDFIKKEFPKYYNLAKSKESIQLSKLQNQLTKNQALIEYFYGDSSIYLFTTTKDKLEIVQAPKSTIPSNITAFRASLNNPKNQDINQFQKLGHQLYLSLLKPAISKLPATINELIIIRDGDLFALPFELLSQSNEQTATTWSDLPYLQNDYTVSYALSATLLMDKYQNKADQNLANNFVGFAPLFEGTRSPIASRSCSIDSLSYLAFNETEVTDISELLAGQVFSGLDANKTAFLNQIKDSRVIHLATHACVDDQNPEQSRIYFTEDYFYLHELYNLNSNAEMVVLSACETGIGAYQHGEGMMSLSHGFAYAGVPSITTSLWSVNDQSTAELMQYYYLHLKAGKAKHQALRQAKLDYLVNQESVEKLHPYYWAGFVHIGDFQPIELTNHTSLLYFWLLGGLAFLSSLFWIFKKYR